MRTGRTLLPLLALTAGLALSGACDIFDDDDDFVFEVVPFETLDTSALAVETASVRVFRDSADWESFWAEHLAAYPPPAAPVVDFDTRMLVGLFWSGRSGCPTELDVVRVVIRTSSEVTVQVGPLPDLGACLAIVELAQVIEIPAIDLPVAATGNVPS